MNTKDQSNTSEEQNSKPYPYTDKELRERIKKATEQARKAAAKDYPKKLK
jgi:hypothetical protein